MIKPLQVAVIGCGLIGSRRAREVYRHPLTRLSVVVDVRAESREALAKEFNCRSADDWKQVIDDPSIDAVIVSTPNGFLAEISIAALDSGKHVLVEKPPGRNLVETRLMAHTAQRAKRILKIGFNHRYHQAVKRAHQLLSTGSIGEIINMRAVYGHGGRPGYGKEWRGNPVLAGGGELVDQGVHIVDLFNWFNGLPEQAFGVLQTAVWPIHPLEDNAFGIFRYQSGAVSTFHTSWTQWRNLFKLEIFGKLGYFSIQGLGGSYGTEQLTTVIRNLSGGMPFVDEERFEQPDQSWQEEWKDFVDAVLEGKTYWGTPEDGVAAMCVIDALYRSSMTGGFILTGGGFIT